MKEINVDSHNVPVTARSKNYQTALATTASSGGGATTPSVVMPTGGAADTAKVAQNLAEDSTDWAKILRKDIDERTDYDMTFGKDITVDGQALLNDVVANTGTFGGMLKAAAATITGALLASTVSATTMTANSFIGELQGNAASATKLKTARTIWGQYDDGSGNVDGTLSLNANGADRNACLKVTANNSLGNGGWNWLASFLSPNAVIGEHMYVSIGKNLSRGNAAGLNFYYNGDDNDYTYIGLDFLDVATKFVVTKAGNVGIGTTSPQYKLDVNGNARMASDLYLDATVGTRNFASHTMGWRADANGNADFRNIYADELRVQAFTADISQALAGSDYLTKSVSKLSANFVVPSVNSTVRIIVDDIEGMPATQCFTNGDYIRFRAFNRTSGLTIANVWGTVVLDTTYGTNGYLNGTQAYTFTCTQTTGAGLTVFKGSEVLDYGTSGSGLIARTTLDAMGSPYEQIATWVNDPSNGNNYTVHARLGNLNGIANCNGYGLYTDNGFFTGKVTVGDLTKTNHYLDFSNGALTVRGDVYLSNGDGVVGSNGVISAINLTRETATIKASKINLDGAVTIGAIDKSSVTPAALGAATPTDVSTAVNGIQVGARNLITGYTMQYPYGNLGSSSYNTSFVADNTTKSGYRYDITITNTNNGSFLGYVVPYLSNAFTRLDGAQIIFSAKIKVSTPRSFQVIYEPNRSPLMVNGTTSYQKIDLIGPNNGTYSAFYFGYQAPFQVGDVISICDMQLSYGNKSVDWSPAPEDVDASISTAQSTADAALTRNNTMAVKLGYTDYNALASSAALGHTLINGGMINTVLINATAVVTNGLTANCITANMISSGAVTTDKLATNVLSVGNISGLGSLATQNSLAYNSSYITNKPNSLSAINTTEGTKLGGIAAGATVGATWGTNVAGIPTNLSSLTGKEGIKNTLITISANGTLSGAGGGQVTVSGIGACTPTQAQYYATTSQNSAQDNLATKLGYTNYSDLVTKAASTDFGTLVVGGYLNTALIQAQAISTNMLAAGSVTANKIAANTITADKIAANSITSDKVNMSEFTASNGFVDSFNANVIATKRLDVAKIVAYGIAAQTIDAQSATISNLNVVNATISGTLNGVSGTFNYLSAVGSTGTLALGTYGITFNDYDISQQGIINGRSLRYYAANIRCRGSFGASSLNMARVHDTYIDYYVNGDLNSYVRFNLQSNGVGGYYIHLYKTDSVGYSSVYGNAVLGDVYGFPVDLVVFDNSAKYHYELIAGSTGKKVTVVNAHDGTRDAAVYLAVNGNLNWEVLAGKAESWVNIRELTNPLISSSVHGAGWMLCGEFDNDWA